MEGSGPIQKPGTDAEQDKKEAKQEAEDRARARNRISAKHDELGGDAGFLGAAVNDVHRASIAGFSQNFQSGTILVLDEPTASAHEVHGLIGAKYFALGGPTRFLGYPVSDETDAGGPGDGRMSSFGGGTILWKRGAPEAFELHGAIRAKYFKESRFAPLLGFPLNDESPTVDGVGRFNHFERGSIYSHPNIGTNEVHGAIRSRYFQLGAEGGELGYPITGEIDFGERKESRFEFGRIEFSPSSGAQEHFEFSSRRVLAEGEIRVFDHELIADEEDTLPVNEDHLVARRHENIRLVLISHTTGNEVTFHLNAHAEGLSANRVRITGDARLEENDGGSKSLTFNEVVMPGESTGWRPDMDIEEKGGSFGLIEFKNTDT